GIDDYWVVKLNSAGDIEWQNTIGGSSHEVLYSVEQTSDGGYILGGNSNSPISGDKTEPNEEGDYWVVKLDESGTIEWQNTIGGNADDDHVYSVQQTADEGYIIGGWSNSDVSGDKTAGNHGSYDYWVIKLDAGGAIEWQNSIGGSSDDHLYSVKQTADGGYILGGESTSGISGNKTEVSMGFSDYWVVKLDAGGAIEWQNTIGGSGNDYLYSVQQTSDGGYILGGHSGSGISGDKSEDKLGFDYWVVKLNGSGVIQWQNTIGGVSTDNLYDVQQTTDGGYILGGSSKSGMFGDKTEPGLGDYDYWIVKLEPEAGCPVIITPLSETTFCEGASVFLQATTGGSTYQWYKNGNPISGATASSYTANKSGNYTVSMNTGSCLDTSDITIVTRLQRPHAHIDPGGSLDICVTGSVLLEANTGTGYGYTWYKNNVNIPGATTSVYTATTVGNYKVKVINSLGCKKTSAVVTVSSTCRIAADVPEGINLYPNPASSELIIEIINCNTGEKQLEIIDALGRTVQSFITTENRLIIDVNILPVGVYFVKMKSDGVIKLTKFMKE
ncbi:MAG: T9SS type A sorting domain-containing protein, partial [Chitinophagales bacterium]|nr:T9SS type A sorting domain-containing protein [Chitinophagales bacterium]